MTKDGFNGQILRQIADNKALLYNRYALNLIKLTNIFVLPLPGKRSSHLYCMDMVMKTDSWRGITPFRFRTFKGAVITSKLKETSR